MRSNLLKISGLFFLAVLYSTAVWADNDNQTDLRPLRREGESQRELAKVARKALKKGEFDKAQKIAFQDILAEPDNVQLNYHYAQQQVAENDLLGAVGTLERILAVRPDLNEIRLFYAVVLYRLDNLPEAEREINILQDVELSSALRSEWKTYKREIKLRQKRTRFGLRQSVGYQFDNNRNAAPSSKQSLFSDIRIDNSAENRRRSDESFLNMTGVDVIHDLGFQAGHTVHGNFNYYLQNQNHLDSLDLGSFDYEVGGTYKTPYMNFTPSFVAAHVYLSDENYLRMQGGNFRVDRTFFEKLNVYVTHRIEHQDYLNIKENTVANERTGVENAVSTGAGYLLTPNMAVNAAALYSYKNAKANYEAYDHWLYRVSHSWLLGRGQFLINAVDFSFDRYDEQDVAIATRFRRDQMFRYRVTYGAPLTFFYIGRFLPGPFQDIIASVSYEYFRSYSNITNYTYTNNKVQALLTKRVEF